MDLSFLIPLVVIVVVMSKVSKEFSKVSRDRPSGGGDDDASGAGRTAGARSIAEFLEELKRQAQASQAPASPSGESDEALQARLREKVREAVRLKREAAASAGQPPPLNVPPPLHTAPVAATRVWNLATNGGSAPEPPQKRSRAPAKTAGERKAGLAHPVFTAPSDTAGVARRAVLLREILGSPVALQGRNATWLR